MIPPVLSRPPGGQMVDAEYAQGSSTVIRKRAVAHQEDTPGRTKRRKVYSSPVNKENVDSIANSARFVQPVPVFVFNSAAGKVPAASFVPKKAARWPRRRRPTENQRRTGFVCPHIDITFAKTVQPPLVHGKRPHSRCAASPLTSPLRTLAGRWLRVRRTIKESPSAKRRRIGDPVAVQSSELPHVSAEAERRDSSDEQPVEQEQQGPASTGKRTSCGNDERFVLQCLPRAVRRTSRFAIVCIQRLRAEACKYCNLQDSAQGSMQDSSQGGDPGGCAHVKRVYTWPSRCHSIRHAQAVAEDARRRVCC
jgi:hypothetical protein